MDGMIMGFLDYNEELKFFGERVLPLMKEAGLRSQPTPINEPNEVIMLVTAVVGSPNKGGRTRVAVDAVLRGAEKEGAETEVRELADGRLDEVVARLEPADAVVFASPTYRADITAGLKALLDTTPRGMTGETSAPLNGKACTVVLTGRERPPLPGRGEGARDPGRLLCRPAALPGALLSRVPRSPRTALRSTSSTARSPRRTGGRSSS